MFDNCTRTRTYVRYAIKLILHTTTAHSAAAVVRLRCTQFSYIKIQPFSGVIPLTVIFFQSTSTLIAFHGLTLSCFGSPHYATGNHVTNQLFDSIGVHNDNELLGHHNRSTQTHTAPTRLPLAISGHIPYILYAFWRSDRSL